MLLAMKSKEKKKRRKPWAYLHADYLSLLGKTKNKRKRIQLLDLANSEQIKAIQECAQNVLEGYIPLRKKDIQCLSKHKTILRRFREMKLSPDQRKELLKQNGGFLNILLPIATGVLSALGILK